MAYRDIIKGVDSSKLEAKEKLVPVFSDIIGKTDEDGLFANFIDDTEENLQSITISNFYQKIFDNHIQKKELEEALLIYQSQFNSRKKWLTLMGLLERKIFQLRCIRKPNLAISIQEQKSGENKFKYILVRAQFVTLFDGKKELRMYMKKLEDYTGYKSLEELKQSDEFIKSAYEAMRKEMNEIVKNEGVSLEYILQELKSIKPEEQLAIQFETDAKKKAEDTRRAEYLVRKEKMMSQYNEEQTAEIELHKSNLSKLKNLPVEREKEKQRHKEAMDRIRREKNRK